MPLSNFLNTDQLKTWAAKLNSSFQYVVGLVTTNHTHDGVDSVKIDHVDLLNKGTSTHAQIDTAISTLDTHIANNTLHGQGVHNNTTDRKTAATSVDDCTHTADSVWDETANRSVQATLDAAAPSAHDSMTGRHTPATDNTDNGSRHKATAIQDVTGERTVQEALDNLEGDVTTLTNGKVNKATVIAEINASTEVVLIEKEHVEQPSLTDEDISAGNYTIISPGGDVPASSRLRTSVNMVSPVLKNLLWNGTFTYLGGDPDNTRNLTKTPQANKDYPFTIPGWKVVTTSTSSYVVLEDITGTPPWHDYQTNNIYHNIFGYRQLTFHNSGDSLGFNCQSAPIPLTEANAEPRFMTVSFWYKTSTVCAIPPFHVQLGGITDLPAVTNDTNWHHYCRSFPVIPDLAPLKIIFLTGISDPDISIARIAVWDAILTSDVHLNPLAWYNPLFLPYNEGATSIIGDTAPTANELFKNVPEFKKTWRAEIPVDTSLSSPLTIPVPPTHYIYNVRVFSDYHITVPIPTTPPTSVDTWYAHADLSANYTAPINSLSLYVPTPPTNNNRIIVEVDYWPADNT